VAGTKKALNHVDRDVDVDPDQEGKIGQAKSKHRGEGSKTEAFSVFRSRFRAPSQAPIRLFPRKKIVGIHRYWVDWPPRSQTVGVVNSVRFLQRLPRLKRRQKVVGDGLPLGST
jgi:hypothetical protein